MIKSTEKSQHLVVTPETHEALVLYAEQRRLTLQEATQELLKIALKQQLKESYGSTATRKK